MKRRDFLRVAGAAAVSSSIRGGTAQAADEDRPNILWISAEDICPMLGCYGDAYATTPHLDALAAEGVLYRRAYAHVGVCAPARSGIITGVYPSTLGSHHMRSVTTLPGHITGFPAYLREAGYYCSNNVKQDYNFSTPDEVWDDSSRRAHWRNRASGQPFFSVFNFEVCHESVLHGPRGPVDNLPKDLKHDPAEAPIPPYHPDVAAFREDWARYYDSVTAMDLQIGKLIDDLEADGLRDSTIVMFWGDHGTGIPRGKRWLWRSGTHIPLIVRCPEKYSHLLPHEPGSETDRLVNFIDFAPSTLNLAGVSSPDHMQGVPFLGEEATTERDYAFFTRDRMDERYDMIRGVSDGRYRYLRNYNPFLPYNQYLNYLYKAKSMVAWNDLAEGGDLAGAPALYMASRKPLEELYDMESDPSEVANLAGSSAHRGTLEALRARLNDWILETGDLGFLDEPEMHGRAGETPEYALAHDRAAYDLPRILETANLPLEGEGAVEELATRVNDDDSGVRYWAVLGLLTLQRAEDFSETIEGRLNDSSISVQIAAAYALGTIGKHEAGLPLLKGALSHDSRWVKLRAANCLDSFGTDKDAVRGLLTTLLETEQDDEYFRHIAEHALSTA
jgi:uncharacterized sulfatase